LIEKLIDPPGEARSDLAVLVDLAERLGHGSLIRARSPQAVWDEWRKVSASSPYNFEGITYKRLRQKRGIQWPCPSEKHPGTVRRYVGGDDPNVSAGQSIEFYGRPDKRAVVYLRAYKPSPEETDTEFPLLLTTGRVLEQWHTGTMTDRIVELQKASGRAQFELSPQDARSLGVANGDRVEVRSRFGTQSGRAVVTDRSRRGVLFASFYDSRFLLNRVVSDHMDPISKQPEFKITAVAVRRI
jgi:nitrate reductase NapA